MGIIGDRPESGVRIEVARDARSDNGPPWKYEGTVATPHGAHPIVATIDGSGEVTVDIEAAAPSEVSEKVRLILRTVYRQAKSEGDLSPARKIVRWRGEK